jgi:alpha-galactosidase
MKLKHFYLFFPFILIRCNMPAEKELNMADGAWQIRNESIVLVLDTCGTGIVFSDHGSELTRCVAEKPAFSVISDGGEIDFMIRKVVMDETDILGSTAKRYTVQAADFKGAGINMNIRVYASDIFPEVLLSDIDIINNSGTPVRLDTLVCLRFSLQSREGDTDESDSPFWAYCGGSYVERFDWIEPLHEGFYRENPMHPNGGNPYTGIWNPSFGLGIMSLELRQAPLVFPVSMETGDRVDIAIEEPINRLLEPGQGWESTTFALLIHQGDIYNGLETWSQLLQVKGMQLPESPGSCFEPVWCGWGYEYDYTNEELLSTIPVAKDMGIEWAVVDYGWGDRNTFWEVHTGKYPDGDASMRAFTDSVRALGMHPKLWYCPGATTYSWPDEPHGAKGTLFVPDERMLILDEAGNTIDNEYFGISLLCPAEESVVEISRDFIRKAMNVWGFEGFKIDGEFFNLFPPCYNDAHEHKSPLESAYAGPLLFKAMYEEAMSIDSNAVFEICCCGSNFSFYNMLFSNQMVSSDPVSSWQIRHRGKIYKALLGSGVAYYGDHVELSDSNNDFASTIGIGGVPGTKFTLIETRKMNEGSKLLTPEIKTHWEKYFRAYNHEMPSEGSYLNLYDIAYDYPEIHVIEKQGAYYYGIFAGGRFSGTIKLKGLDAGTQYSLIDYIGNRVLTDDLSLANNELSVEFENHLLLKAEPISTK